MTVKGRARLLPASPEYRKSVRSLRLPNACSKTAANSLSEKCVLQGKSTTSHLAADSFQRC
jgi:hypothetical protein